MNFRTLILLLLIANLLSAQSKTSWVDSIYNSLTIEQKIGQLFMPMVFSEGDVAHYQQAIDDIEKRYVGGIIFSRGTIDEHVRLTNLFQKKSKIPLLMAMDAEWGMAMRLSDVEPFPYQMTLGAIQNDSLLYKMGQSMAKRQRRLGVHLNFAPVVDLNTNPKNPIIGLRSFGSNPDIVANKALSLAKGMEHAGLLTSIKHFPGHGDTSKDSHLTLPKINHNISRLHQVELQPFKKLIKADVSSVMIAHLEVPALEKKKGLPSSLSSSIVTDFLKNKLGFSALVVTDALNMKGVSDYDSKQTASLGAFLAGADLLLIPSDLSLAVADIRKAYDQGKISELRLSHSVKKILTLKQKANLHLTKFVNSDSLIEDIHSPSFSALTHELAEASLTVVRNENQVLPIKDISQSKIAYVSIGQADGEEFNNRLLHYTDIDKLTLTEAITNHKAYTHILVGLHQPDKTPWEKHTLDQRVVSQMTMLAKQANVILVSFANPYSLSALPLESCNAVILAYQNASVFQSKAAQLVFGGIGANGRLPVDVSSFKQGEGIDIAPIGRLSYGHPKQVDLDGKVFKKIDQMAQQAITDSVTPGMQILIARKGKVVYHKPFGFMRYEKKTPIQWFNRYDLASLTKILASVPLAMVEHEKDSLFLSTPIAKLLHDYEYSNKSEMNFRALFSHHAGIQPWLPFYKNTLNDETKQPLKKLYKNKTKRRHRLQVSTRMFLRTTYMDSIKNEIINSPLLDSLYYKYSDLPYYIFKDYVEHRYQKRLDKLITSFLYLPIGANHMGYLPLTDVSKDHIVPSEIDTYFRHSEIQGYVHDMGAAMQNGVGGHAGLFSNANDVAKVAQMYLQDGTYGEDKFFEPSTIDYFNKRYYADENNRRGIGFDKQQFEDPGPTCLCASDDSFGHSGFTGTFVWVDPSYDLVYVFLSNRTYPTMENTKMVDTNLRSEIQRVIYNALIK